MYEFPVAYGNAVRIVADTEADCLFLLPVARERVVRNMVETLFLLGQSGKLADYAMVTEGAVHEGEVVTVPGGFEQTVGWKASFLRIPVEFADVPIS